MIGLGSRVVALPPRSGLVSSLQGQGPAIALAATLGLSVMIPNSSAMYLVSMVLLVGAVMWIGVERRPTLLVVALAGLGALSLWPLISVGSGWEPTLLRLLWIGPFAALFFLRRVDNLWYWMVPVILIHASAALYQGIGGEYARAPGIVGNPNPAGGLLVLGAVVALVTRRPALGILLVFALAFTGSRWALITLVGVTTLALALRSIRLRDAVLVAVASLLLVLPFKDQVFQAFRVDRIAAAVEVQASSGDAGGGWLPGLPNSLSLGTFLAPVNVVMATDVEVRVGAPKWPSLVPKGSFGSERHPVPIRVATQAGIVGGVLWMAVTGWALWRRPWRSLEWWALLTVTAFGVFDYYTWEGSMAAFPWLLMGMAWWRLDRHLTDSLSRRSVSGREPK